MNKKCFKCGAVKPLDGFYRHRQMGDGRLNKCKECTKLDTKARYYSPEGREKVAEYESLRFQTAHRKAKVKLYQAKARKQNPGKFKARAKLLNAIRGGKIQRKPCEACGLKAQAHHTDYRRPLAVRWLCFKHHREIGHGQLVYAHSFKTPLSAEEPSV